MIASSADEAEATDGPRDDALLDEYRRRRDDAAFRRLVDRHGAMVYRVCFRLLGNHQDAEDACQAAFVGLARRHEAVRESVAGWLATAARHAALDIQRAAARRRRREEVSASGEAALDAGDLALREELDAALAQLPDGLREAVVLRYLEGHDTRAAACLAGCPQGTLGRRAAEGLRQLRGFLVRRGWVLTVPALQALLTQEAQSAAPPVSVKLPVAAAAAPTRWLALACLGGLLFLLGALAVGSMRPELPRVRPVGGWERTVGDVQVRFDITSQSLRCTLRRGGQAATVDADYQVTRDGRLFGILTAAEVPDGVPRPRLGELFQARYRLTPEGLVLTDLQPGEERLKDLLNGAYQRAAD